MSNDTLTAVTLSDDARQQLAKALDALHEAAKAVDGFIRAPRDDTQFDAVAALPETLHKTGVLLSEVMGGLVDAKQARLAELKKRLDAVKARPKKQGESND